VAKQTLSNWEGRHKSPAYWWSVGFGSGLLKPAPGTWGSLVGLVLGYGLVGIVGGFWWLIVAIISVTLVSIFAISAIEKATGIHDAPEIVIDEFAGQWVAMLPLAFFPFGIWELLTCFGLFRLFDIIKPWPIGLLDRKVSGGFGVMVDDLVAGVIAAAILVVLIFYTPIF